MNFVMGKPNGRLIWSFGGFNQSSYTQILGQDATQEARIELLKKQGHCFIWRNAVPYREFWDGVEKKQNNESDTVQSVEFKSRHGILQEKRLNGELAEFKVKTIQDLKIFTAMCGDLRIEPDPETYEKERLISAQGTLGMPPQPLALMTPSSPVQELLEYVTGVENFYYLLQDEPTAMAELLDVMQENQRRRYRILAQFEADIWYQGENTSTSLISPSCYEQYSLPQIREYADFAHKAGKRAIVHMCGLLRDLLPLIVKTGINGVHSLTPPQTGNVPFETALEAFPTDFSILGRLNSIHWLGRSEEEILSEFRRMIPRRLVKERPFILWITADGVSHIPKQDFVSVEAALLRFRDEIAR